MSFFFAITTKKEDNALLNNKLLVYDLEPKILMLNFINKNFIFVDFLTIISTISYL